MVVFLYILDVKCQPNNITVLHQSIYFRQLQKYERCKVYINEKLQSFPTMQKSKMTLNSQQRLQNYMVLRL